MQETAKAPAQEVQEKSLLEILHSLEVTEDKQDHPALLEVREDEEVVGELGPLGIALYRKLMDWDLEVQEFAIRSLEVIGPIFQGILREGVNSQAALQSLQQVKSNRERIEKNTRRLEDFIAILHIEIGEKIGPYGLNDIRKGWKVVKVKTSGSRESSGCGDPNCKACLLLGGDLRSFLMENL